jgi:geranylgeranyl pyrophosphate synthase
VSRIAAETMSQSGPNAASLLASLAQEIDADLANRLAKADLPENLRAAVMYSSLDGGKRLRPVLTLLCCEAMGGNRQAVMPAASAIELIHCFSLVHDDLPAMDDDDLRRGKPTLHKHAGEAMAILAGDVMVSLAFEFIAAAPGLDGDARAALTAELARATTGMISGQVYDTIGGLPANLKEIDRLHLIHRHKTGALIRAACRMGAIGGGASPQQLAALTRYGESMGLMFQVIDDLLDVTQSTEHTGKATGKDHAAGKLTFPGLLGVEASQREVARLRESALNAIDALGSAAQPLRDLCEHMAVRTR